MTGGLGRVIRSAVVVALSLGLAESTAAQQPPSPAAQAPATATATAPTPAAPPEAEPPREPKAIEVLKASSSRLAAARTTSFRVVVSYAIRLPASQHSTHARVCYHAATNLRQTRTHNGHHHSLAFTMFLRAWAA